MDILDTEVIETENVPAWISDDISWIAVFYLSLAVDLWAGTLEIPEKE